MMYFRLLAIVMLGLLHFQCRDPLIVPDPFPTAYDADRFDTDLLATEWYMCATRCIEEHPSFTDPIAARVYAYMGVTLYQSLVWGMPGYRSLEGQLRWLTDLPRPDTAGKRYYWALVANAALAEVLRGLLPATSHSVQRRIDSLEAANVAERWLAQRDTLMLARSVAYGKALAQRILELARTDGGEGAWENLFPPDFELPPLPGVWTPTASEFPRPLLPQWQSVRFFAINDTTVESPPVYSTDRSSAFYTAADSVRQRIARATELQLDDARYWINQLGQPPTFPGHLVRIATQLIRTGPYRLGFGALVYLRLGVVLHDGYVLAWKAKYRYPLLRPESYIRATIDSRYRAPLSSPPTPEYVSERALIATAVTVILQEAFRSPFPAIERITDRTHVERGILEREWRTLTDMAAEIVTAERSSGLQYDFSVEVGVKLGRRAAYEVLSTVLLQ